MLHRSLVRFVACGLPLAALLLAGCQAAPTATTATTPTSPTSPSAVEGATASMPSTPTAQAGAAPAAQAGRPVADVQPTLTADPQDERTPLETLPIGQPGAYVNVTFGYQLSYPEEWHTGFGRRPLLVSFSNLDPGANNRPRMRSAGCLIEVNASTNIYALTLGEVAAQLPGAFADAEPLELGGASATRVRRSSPDNPFDSETVYVEHDGRLYIITHEYAREASETCLPVWETLLESWVWFEPQTVVYRNPEHGYAVSHPRPWYRFAEGADGVAVSSADPTAAEHTLELARRALVVETDVRQNPDGHTLREWVDQHEVDADIVLPLNVDGLIGLRGERRMDDGAVTELTGYFQGPLGDIYTVTARYPTAQSLEFRPLASAVLYSFTF